MIHQVERIASGCMYVTVYTIASSIHIPYLLEQAPRCLLNFSRLKCGAYSRAALIQGWRLFKNWTRQRKNAENRLLALTNFFVANAALIRVNTVNPAKT